MSNRNLLINATMIFVLATMLHQNLHELAHFAVAIICHSKDIALHHNYVQHDSTGLSTAANIAIAAAGPLFSLFAAIKFQVFCVVYQKRNLLYLFFLYMSAFGYINFGGYLLIAPFFTGGDTGFVFQQLGFPLWLIIIFSIAGAVFLFFSMKMLSKYFIGMASPEIIVDKTKRKAFMNLIVEYPLYIGAVLTTLLNLPVVTFLSLLYPLFSPFSLLWSYGYLLNTPFPTEDANPDPGRLATISPLLVAALALTILLNRLLVAGFYW